MHCSVVILNFNNFGLDKGVRILLDSKHFRALFCNFRAPYGMSNKSYPISFSKVLYKMDKSSLTYSIKCKMRYYFALKKSINLDSDENGKRNYNRISLLDTLEAIRHKQFDNLFLKIILQFFVLFVFFICPTLATQIFLLSKLQGYIFCKILRS